MKKFILSITGFFAAMIAYSQDSQYTQFYAAQTSLNPAFAGGSIENRFIANYRHQWTGVGNPFVNYSVSYDKYLPNINSGVGLIVHRETAGAGGLSNTNFGVQYAYEARLWDDFYFRPGIQFSYVNKSIDFSQLIFTDQMIRDGDPATLEAQITEPVGFFDFAVGGVLNNKKFWLGFSVHHLAEPNEALYQYSESLLPRKYSLHGGYKLNIRDKFGDGTKNNMVFAANYKSQGDFDQLDMGIYFELDALILGTWYRNLPLKTNGYSLINHDALAFIVGYQVMKYKIGYSYDVTVSQLSVGSTGGSHEISLTYEWANKKNKKLAKRRIIPCAKF